MEYGKKIRLGGFNLLKYKNKDEQTFIKVSTVMGVWSMEYREDNALFPFLDKERIKDEDDALQIIFINAFMAATFAEADFQHDILLASDALRMRIDGGAEQLSDEEDAEIIENMKAEHDIAERLYAEEEKADKSSDE